MIDRAALPAGVSPFRDWALAHGHAHQVLHEDDQVGLQIDVPVPATAENLLHIIVSEDAGYVIATAPAFFELTPDVTWQSTSLSADEGEEALATFRLQYEAVVLRLLAGINEELQLVRLGVNDSDMVSASVVLPVPACDMASPELAGMVITQLSEAVTAFVNLVTSALAVMFDADQPEHEAVNPLEPHSGAPRLH